ncbi:MAG: UDP-N-acetylmuramoyl-L-alanine--D-glutamate ligase [Microbacteriaceae bacterium]
MRSSELRGRPVLVLGTGREGRAAVAALRGIAASIVATTDDAVPDDWRPDDWPADVPVLVRPAADRLGPGQLGSGRLGLGQLGPGVLAPGLVAVVSPGVPPRHPLVVALAAAGVPVTSGTDLWMSGHAAATLAVTGSKGKSTTSSLAHALLPGSVYGGNIGLPLLALPEGEQYVVELSSYQCRSLTTSPDVAAVTALYPEHLDWHGDLEQYYTDKLNILRHGPRLVVANGENPDVVARVPREAGGVPVRWVGREPSGAAAGYRLEERAGGQWIVRDAEPVLPARALRLRGRHNALNAAIALAAADAARERLGAGCVPAAEAAERLAAFEPLPHRLQPVTDPRGEVVFVDDSLSTTPFAAIEALRAFPDPGAVLIVGGQDRGVDYAPLAAHLATRPIRAVIGLPPSGARIAAELPGPTELAADLPDAVARALARGATTVILSPAAPSYGVYRDYADRAEHFVRTIKELRA